MWEQVSETLNATCYNNSHIFKNAICFTVRKLNVCYQFAETKSLIILNRFLLDISVIFPGQPIDLNIRTRAEGCLSVYINYILL